MPQPSEPTRHLDSALAGVLHRNIEAVLERRSAEEKARRPADRLADSVTTFAGSMTFVYLHLAFFGTWIVCNIPGVPLPKFDPSFVILAMWASVEAIFLSTFVLISQNRMAEVADRRADLNLQISLLAEHEVTRLIHLVTAIGVHLNLEEARHPEIDELKKDVEPEKVLDHLGAAQQAKIDAANAAS